MGYLLPTILAAIVGFGATASAEEKAMGEKIIMAEGLTVHIDPKTGKIAPPPPGDAQPPLSPSEKESTSTSSEGLTEKPSPQGGYGVDLKGRFQNR